MNCKTALQTVLDQVDYTNRACSPTEMIGAILPREVILLAKEAIANEDKQQKAMSYCKTHNTYPAEGEPCWQCVNPYIDKLNTIERMYESALKVIQKFKETTKILGGGVGHISANAEFFAKWNEAEVEASELLINDPRKKRK